MTQQTRTTALQEAVKASAVSGGEADILSLAEQFNSFLTSDDAPSAAPAAPATPAPTPKAKAAKPKAAKVTEPTEEPDAPVDEDDVEDAAPSADDVKAVISNLIGAGQRDELVNLLKKFKATSFSGIKAADYAKFVAEGNQITENAKLAQ